MLRMPLTAGQRYFFGVKMADNKEPLIREVKTDWEELEAQIRRHRRRRHRRTLLIAVCAAAFAVIFYIGMQLKTYGEYRTADSIERSDTQATQFLEADGAVLKYSNDGAMYTTIDNEVIWNQTFEMENPLAAVCGDYAAFADTDGQEIYVLNEDGLQGQFETGMAIQKIDVSSGGTVAVLMSDGGVSYLALYDETGECLAEGAIHMENAGYPLDIALTQDGKKLAVAVLDVASGSACTNVYFYNFDSVGQEEVDNIVNEIAYDDLVIPMIVCADGNRLLAFSDSGVMIYEGSQIPEETGTVTVSGEIKSVFYDDSYIGLVYTDEEAGERTLAVYNAKGAEVMQVSLDISYDDIYFLENHEVCIQNSEHCEIYTLHGIRKFAADFEEHELYYCMSRTGLRGYTFLIEGSTEKVWLKFFSALESDEE